MKPTLIVNVFTRNLILRRFTVHFQTSNPSNPRGCNHEVRRNAIIVIFNATENAATNKFLKHEKQLLNDPRWCIHRVKICAVRLIIWWLHLDNYFTRCRAELVHIHTRAPGDQPVRPTVPGNDHSNNCMINLVSPFHYLGLLCPFISNYFHVCITIKFWDINAATKHWQLVSYPRNLWPTHVMRGVMKLLMRLQIVLMFALLTSVYVYTV